MGQLGQRRLPILLAIAFACACAAREPAARAGRIDCEPAGGTSRGATTDAGTEFTLFLSANLRGALAPCGCSEVMRGGVARLAEQIAHARQNGEAVLYFDVGNTLFPSSEFPLEAVAQQELKARTMSAALSAIGLDAHLAGVLDLARGRDWLSELRLPEVPGPGRKSFDVAGHQLALVTASSAVDASKLAREARARGAEVVIAAIPRSFEALLRGHHEAPEVDLIVATGDGGGEVSNEVNRLAGGTPRVVHLQPRGQSLLRLDVALPTRRRPTWAVGEFERSRELDALDQRIEILRAQVNEPTLGDEMKHLRKAKLLELVERRAALAATAPVARPRDGTLSARFIPIEPSLPESGKVKALVAAYDAEVGEMNLGWAREHGRDCAPPTVEARGFVGTSTCVGCHPRQADFWKRTKHARSFGALRDVGKQFHLDCIGCHVTGWQQRGGVCRIDKTAERDHVGCEACHGPGSEHVRVPIKRTIALGRVAKTCTGCHDAENSPHFDFEKWVTQVTGDGHGG
jgi:hypothetical protein